MTDTDTEGTDELELRAWAAKLFAPDIEDDEADEPDEQQKPPGYVAKEGNNLRPGPDPDKDMREFVRDLFGDDLNFRNT